MAASRVTATGVPTTPGPNGSLPLRREVRDLQANYRDQWNLFILGLADFQRRPVSELLSYYQIAGIHGEPFVPWNGVTGNANASFGGYCTHSSIIFLTWHRPYLALFEQALHASIQSVANQFPQRLRARYTTAARDFRLPYWDWAARVSGSASAFPTSFSATSISVVDVDGVTKTIANPLFNFRFAGKQIPQNLSLDDYWSQFPDTKRAPDGNGNSRNALVSRVISNENASLRNNISVLLMSYNQFDSFSNNVWAPGHSTGDYGSLEDVHNEIHDTVGQGGHMASLAVSSFDPVFWLHHANVDRLWAIWQALNPNAYVIDKTASAREANFTIAAGTRLTVNSSLQPFYDSSATRFWSSAGVKFTTPFGYAYPETQRWLYTSDQAYQQAIRSEVTRQYGANVITNFFASMAPAASASSAPTSSSTTAANRLAIAAQPAKELTTAELTTQPVQAMTASFDAADTLESPESSETETSEASESCNPEDGPVWQLQEPQNTSLHTQEQPQAPPKPYANICEPIHLETLKQPHKDREKPHDETHEQTPKQRQTPPGTHTSSDSQPDSPAQPVALGVPPEFEHLVLNREYTEWITNLRATKHGLGQTFRVHVFLGDFNPDPATWPTEYNAVGRFTVLGQGPETRCQKCRDHRERGLVVRGTVPLTSALLQDIVTGQLESLEREVMVPYLKRHLHWRVTTFDGGEMPRDQVPGLKVGVVSTKVRIGDDGVPIYSQMHRFHPIVTRGRPGGMEPHDEDDAD